MIFQVITPGLSIYSYIILETVTKKAVVIDPPRNPSEIERIIAEMQADLKTALAGTSTSVALQVGDAFTWCQSSWGWSDPGVTATVNIDLTSGFSCDLTTLTDVRGIFVWFSAGTFDVDNFRAE